MHLSLNHGSVLKAIDLIARAADKNHRFAILGNIRFDLTETTLILTASDLEVELIATVSLPKGACLEPGSITLPAGKFHEICKSLPEGTLSIQTLDDGKCRLSLGKSKFTLPILPASDFPSIGTPDDTACTIGILRSELLSMIAHTKFCMAANDVRHYLTGMLFHLKDASLTTVATDGHRLAMSVRLLGETHENETQLIVPGKAVVELERLFGELAKSGEKDGLVQLQFDREFLQVGLGFEQGADDTGLHVAMTARLIDGKFPDYRRVLPTQSDKAAIFQKDAMLAVLKRVSILASERTKGLVFNFENNNVIISTGEGEGGEAKEDLDICYEHDPIEISLNEAYLKAVLGVLQGDIKLEMSQPNSPTLITQVGDELHKYVIMPMRI